MPSRCVGVVFSLVFLACVAAVSGQGARSGVTTRGLAYDIEGDGDAVVLIHAFSVDRRMWDREVQVLRSRVRVIRYDLPGHGQSPMPAEPYAPHEDLKALLDELGVARAALVGLSAGTAVAADFAIAYPDRVTKLVLASPSVNGYVPKGSMEWMKPVFDAARAGDARGAAERWAETPIMRVDDPGAAARLRRLVLDNTALWGLASNPQRSLQPQAFGRLAEIRTPVLVLVGERDTDDIHAVANALSTQVTGAKRIVIPGAGHMLNFAAPEVFGRALVEFLTARYFPGNGSQPRLR